MMKRNFIIILLLLNSIIICSQKYRFIYEMRIRPNALDKNNLQYENVILDVENDENLFYSYEYYHTDSLNIVEKKNNFAYPKFSKIIKYIQNKEEYEVYNKISINYYVFKTSKKINWEVLGERKKIGEFNAQKAKCIYGGRHWEAWFTEDIPLPYGPYFFNGLPGLVIEIYDKDEDYKFSIIKNYKLKNSFSELIKKYIGLKKYDIQEKDIVKLKQNYFNKPLPNYREGNYMILNEDGSQYSLNDYKKLENGIRDDIKKYNNPIELDEKIIYK